jgi:hypothetical protein
MHQFVNLFKFINFEIYSKSSKVLGLVLLDDVGLLWIGHLELCQFGYHWDNMRHTCLLFYFCDCILGNIIRIFLKYFWKNLRKFPLNFKNKSSYYFIKNHVKNLAKKVIFRKIEIYLQVFVLLKNKHYNV